MHGAHRPPTVHSPGTTESTNELKKLTVLACLLSRNQHGHMLAIDRTLGTTRKSALARYQHEVGTHFAIRGGSEERKHVRAESESDSTG